MSTRDSGPPGARTVVLRAFAPARLTCDFWTDRRTAKVRDIAARPAASLLFLDRGQMLQLRLSGRCEAIDSGPDRDTALEQARAASLDDYTTHAPPGSALGEGEITRDLALATRTFVLLRFTIETGDILKLSRSGHRRIALDWRAGGVHRDVVP